MERTTRTPRHSWATRVLLAGTCAMVLACQGTSNPDTGHLVTRSRVTMGSALHLSAWTSDEPGALRAFEAVFAEFDRLDALLSVWQPDSDVVRINAAAGQRAVPVGPEVRTVLAMAHQISEWTGGKFDVTFGPLADVWKFDHDQDNIVPSPEAVQRRLGLVDYTAVEVDDQAGTVFVKRPGMRIHLGGIGKGYAVDRARQILRARGIDDFMIQSGGDLYVGGLEGGRPWRLGIADPRNPSQIFGSLDVSNATFSTSGDYERAFIKDGRRYHHLLDPDLGEPARGCRSVTVVTISPLVADGLSTGVFIMGPSDGMALIERLPDVEGIIVSQTNEVLVSSGLRETFTRRAPPTDGL